jgi:nitroreductase
MPAELPSSVDEAITSRQSVRRFLDEPVSREQVAHLLDVARWAPSGTNTQPWKVYAISGEPKAAMSQEILAYYHAHGDSSEREYEYYPTDWFQPYLGRRRACGWGMYGSLGITREMKAEQVAQTARNYLFFDAPVALLFGIDKRLNVGSWMDLGMFLENIMIAARGRGLHTCAQASLANYPWIVRKYLPFPEEEAVVCGMAVGYRDADAPENVWRTERESVEGFTRWVGFE